MNHETGTDVPPDPPEDGAGNRCTNCGTRLDPGAWHPTIGYTDADGIYRIVRFCTEACRDEWLAAHESD